MTMTNSNIIVGVGASLKIATAGTAEGSATDVGATEGGIEISIEREYYEKTADQSINILEMIKTSEKPKLKVTLAESTLDNLRIGMDYPSTALVSSILTIGGNATATPLVIYANVIAVSGGTRKYTFYKVIPISAATHSYKKDDKTMIEFEFAILADTTKSANEQIGTVVDSSTDTTAPTIAMTTPADGGTVTKDTAGTVILTITEINAMDEGTIVYGDTVSIVNQTTPATAVLEPGSIVYDATAKTITFTPTNNWTASEEMQVVVTTGLKDANGNALATMFLGQFSVTA
jgi:hypothetical protein